MLCICCFWNCIQFVPFFSLQSVPSQETMQHVRSVVVAAGVMAALQVWTFGAHLVHWIFVNHCHSCHSCHTTGPHLFYCHRTAWLMSLLNTPKTKHTQTELKKTQQGMFLHVLHWFLVFVFAISFLVGWSRLFPLVLLGDLSWLSQMKLLHSNLCILNFHIAVSHSVCHVFVCRFVH